MCEQDSHIECNSPYKTLTRARGREHHISDFEGAAKAAELCGEGCRARPEAARGGGYEGARDFGADADARAAALQLAGVLLLQPPLRARVLSLQQLPTHGKVLIFPPHHCFATGAAAAEEPVALLLLELRPGREGKCVAWALAAAANAADATTTAERRRRAVAAAAHPAHAPAALTELTEEFVRLFLLREGALALAPNHHVPRHRDTVLRLGTVELRHVGIGRHWRCCGIGRRRVPTRWTP